MMIRLARVSLALCGVVLATACVRMPSEGPVTEVDTEPSSNAAPGISYDPAPPQEGETSTEIVANFLEAMKATPSKTSVAREFLTNDAQRRWTPESSILTYAELGDPVGDLEVSLKMTGIEEYDARGAWQRSRPDRTMQFELASEDGEWRIDGLPDALIVPGSWFEDWFRQVSLYFFDPTGQILVPEPVFIPAGDTVASSMVDGLLDDATTDPRLSRTFVPPGFTSGVSVPITSAGIAEVSLEGNPAEVDEEVTQRILTQLIWTMRQEPRIRAVQLMIGDEQQDLPGVATQVNLDVGDAYDPTGASSSSDLFALLDGRVVRGSIGSFLATDGPMGTDRLGVRSIGVSLAGDRVAGVSGNGRSVLVAPVDGEGRAVEVASDAQDLLPPAWDFADRLWLADRAEGGAVISVQVGEQKPRKIEVPGVSGRDVRNLLISRDGSRLVAVVRTTKGDRVLVSRILRSDTGRVLQATGTMVLDFTPDVPGQTIRDIGWRSPTAVSVLTVTDEQSQVETVSVDGSPGNLVVEGASRLRGAAGNLVSSPVPRAEVYAVAGADISDLTVPERSVGPLPEGLSSLTYVG